MKSNYKRIGQYIRQVKTRNKDLALSEPQGIKITKEFMPSVANTIGTDLSKYRVVSHEQFAYNPMHVGRDEVLPISMLQSKGNLIVSPAYIVFEIIDKNELLPEYLMMWCRRPEFDRNAWFTTDSSVRGGFSWSDFCDMELPVPSIEKQREIVQEYNVIVNRIKLNEQLNQKLEDTAQAIYKHWFVDFEFPYAENIELVDSGSKAIGKIPKGWSVKTLGSISSKIGSGATPRGGKASYTSSGTSLIRSMNIHDLNFKYKELAFINDDQSQKLKGAEVLAGDVLINITGASVARCSFVPSDVLPARVNQHVAIIRLKSCSVFPYFLTLYLSSQDAKARLLGTSGSGSTREALTKGDLEEFEILFPHENILKEFEEYVETILIQHSAHLKENEFLFKMKDVLLASIATYTELNKAA